ncbi:MAG TPA: peroxidase family protein [Chthoniobacterales bacterium]|nr:peroxidase family protein [Chthoniobacterales bacterium]
MFPAQECYACAEDDLIELASLMVDDPLTGGGGNPPGVSMASGLLYLAQFVDHDLTLDTTSLARTAEVPPEERHNYRSPFLDLESLYGGGPKLSPYLYYLPAGRPSGRRMPPGHERFLLGKTSPSGAELDLPRTSMGRPIMAEPRNEENLILAQLHVAMLRFHNRIMDALENNEITVPSPGAPLFPQAQRLVKWHYQYVVLNELLHFLLEVGGKEEAIANALPISAVPIEFALAGFRIGHSMVRNFYQMNTSHQMETEASLTELMRLNSQSEPPFEHLTDEWTIEWKRFFDDFPELENRSRALDTSIAKALHHLDFEVPIETGENPRKVSSLPAITLLRGQRSQLPSGGTVAKIICEEPLTEDDMLSGHAEGVSDMLERLGWIDDAPLWFYILQEGAVRGEKRWLGPVGSHIVGRTIVGLLKADPDSILTAGRGWTPSVWNEGGWCANKMGRMVGLATGLIDPHKAAQ